MGELDDVEFCVPLAETALLLNTISPVAVS